jgi:hypothetical protein
MQTLKSLIEYQIYCDMDGVLTTEYKQSHTKKEFWNEVAKGKLQFWSDMKWMPDGQQLWNFIKSRAIILSAPSSSLPDSSRGKMIWVAKNIGPNVKLILRKAEEKKDFANAKSILIDDLQKNILQWEQAGGIGIHHISAINTIKKLNDILNNREK